MNFKNEKKLVNIIKYSLPLIILFLSIIIISFLYFQHKENVENLKEITKNQFIKHQKELSQENINNIVSYIIQEQEENEEGLKNILKERVLQANQTISDLYTELKDKYTKEEIIDIIKLTLRGTRFNDGRGYFFINTNSGINVLHSLKPSIEGSSTLGIKDLRGTYLTQVSVDILKENDFSFLTWYWPKSKDDDTQYRKIGFIKNVDHFDWFIGTGEYVDDFFKYNKQHILSHIIKLKYKDNQNIFIFDQNKNLLSTSNKKLDLENIKHILNEKHNINKDEHNFYEAKDSNHIIYFKKVPKWNWYIGTSFNKSDIQKKLDEEKNYLVTSYQKNIQDVLIFCIALSSLFLIISFYVSNNIQKKFKRYKSDIKKQMLKNKKQQDLLAQKTKLEAMGEMMENIAHQWRQPLSMITVSATSVSLQKDLGNLDDKFLQESLDNIHNYANYLSDTIEDFRDFFRPDKEKTVFSIRETINKSLKLLESQFKNNNIKIITEIEDTKIQSFQRELLQVILNILNNAKDALSDNTKTKEEKLIFISTQTKKNKVLIKIQDNASGISQNIISRIFEPYFTTKHKSQGTGIGLYMSQEIITKHLKGSIKVENCEYEYEEKNYKGAVFIISIPLKN